MSFILEALKKLEQKQKRGAAPNLMTEQAEPPEGPKKRPLWMYLLVGVLLLNAVLLVAWLFPRGSDQQIVATQRPEERRTPVEKSAAFTAPQKEKTALPVSGTGGTEALPESRDTVDEAAEETVRPVEKSRRVPPEAELKNPSAEEREPRLPAIGTIDPAPSLHTPPSAITTAPAETGTSERPETDTGEGTITMQELPSSVREKISKITISGHIFSNIPRARIININGQILREGDSSSEGLKVVEITPSGAMLMYEEHFFFMRAF